MLRAPASVPKKALPLPVLAAPAPTPAKVLANPLILNTREAPILNCVVALTTFPDSVPPAVPLPEMLKLAF